jgi:parallel beta-helix repeat protein
MFGMTHATYAATFCASSVSELQTALTTATSNNEDDKIKIVQGTYEGKFQFISAEQFNLTIEGGYTAGCASRVVDAENTVIDGDSSGNVLLLVGGNNVVDFVIDGLMVINGNATTTPKGGGLHIKTNGGEVTLSNNIISDNSANDAGGGAYIEGATTATLTNNTVENNTKRGVSFNSLSIANLTDNTFTGNSGGGVYFNSSTTATLEDNTFTGNSGGSGAGAYFDSSSTATLKNNVITDNMATSCCQHGGGVYFKNSTATLTGNVITDNMTGDNGGGIYFYNGTATLTGNTITGNAANSGGGVHIYGGTAASLINNVISANTANNVGGGLYIYRRDTTTLTNNTITDNHARNNGGGIWFNFYDDTDAAHIYNNIIWNNNAAGEADDIYINNDANNNFILSPVDIFNNDFEQSEDGLYITIPFSIDSSNLDNLNPLIANAGNEDYYLQAGSPCIEAGDNDAPLLPTTDIDGNPRIVNGIVDIGAYEQQVAANSYLQFSKADYSVKENKNSVTIAVTRTDGSSGSVSVDYTTSDETATAGSDYNETSGTLNWEDGDASKKTFTVNIIDDSKVENDETVILSLGNVTGGAGLGDPDTAELTITDDDAASTDCTQVTQISSTECKALIALYESTDGENWADNTGWNVTNTPCDWNGVFCQGGKVTRLTLGNNNLKGAISKKFFKLKKLKTLVLSDNDLNGTNLDNFNKLKKLEELLVNNCNLEGNIPDSLMKLKNLWKLDLKDNCLSTQVSDELKEWLDKLNPGWDDSQCH